MEKANAYLQQVIDDQERVVQELKKRPMRAPAPGDFPPPQESGGRSIDVRITGFWRWRTVVVPPNVYVVHTRRGHPDPIHIGLGISFRFDPCTDHFLVIPAAMQTIPINARCICADRQGILVQAYVQWIIHDIATAYRKLDFSDVEDPMRIVEVQLREQAEAAIKDKVSTMRIDEVLADKRPIIEELTHRLREVAEGSDSGLGLKIVTVQIKEAVVSSTRLWENLQKPFRAEQEKIARLAELASSRAIQTQELLDQQERETSRIRTEEDLARLGHERERREFDLRIDEETRRRKVEDEAGRQREALETAAEIRRRERKLELATKQVELAVQEIEACLVEIASRERLDLAEDRRDRSRAERDLERENLVHQAAHDRELLDLERDHRRRRIENEISPARVHEVLVHLLPEIASRIPAPANAERIHISTEPDAPEGWGSLFGLVRVVRDLLGRTVGPAKPEGAAAATKIAAGGASGESSTPP